GAVAPAAMGRGFSDKQGRIRRRGPPADGSGGAARVNPDPTMSLTSTDVLGEMKWIPHPRSSQLRRLGLETVGDLLTHYPRRHEDRQAVGEFSSAQRENTTHL